MSSNKELTTDQRFSRVMKDPRFWEMPEKDKRIKIDKRFKAMFHDKKFSLNYSVDKRGRPINHSTTEDLKRYYDLSDSSDEASEKESKVDTSKGKQKAKLKKKVSKETDKTSGEVPREKKKVQMSNETNNTETKKGKVEENQLAKDENKRNLKSLKTAHQSTNDGQPVKKSVQKAEQEVAEELGIDAESDVDSEANDSDEDGSGMTGTDLDEEGSDEEDEGDTSEESDLGSEVEDSDSDSGPDLARGKGNIETSSEDDDDDDDNDEADVADKDTEVEHAWRDLDKDAPRAEEVTRRLAVCNMDWDRLKAKDLLALFNSFKPKGGIVFSVNIYPSEFGKERLKEEELQGPVELKNISEDVAEEQGLYKEKLREYQFKRLKYYYAVVECDSSETANKIYDECDGLEFESSCSFVDLRFIPDDVQFSDEPKDSAVDVDLAAYQPKLFTSAANVTAKVQLTWDETDQERVSSLNRPFKKNEILDMDFQAYLASSSDEEVEEEILPVENEDGKIKKGSKDDEDQISRYRDLLKSIQEKEKKQEEKGVEMEVKWVPGLKESAEQMVKNKLEGKDKLTPWEKYLQKQKDKRKMKRKKDSVEEKDEEVDDEMPSDVDLNDSYFSEELSKAGVKKKSAITKKEQESSSEEEEDKERKQAEMALLMMDDVEDDRKHFNYDKIVEQQNLSRSKKKKLKKKEQLVEDEFQINVEDSRFQAMYTSHLYNVDPSDPNFKKTKAMERVLEEKARRREQEHKNYTDTVKKHQAALESAQKVGVSAVKTSDPSLSSLLKSVKSKTQQFQASKKRKIK